MSQSQVFSWHPLSQDEMLAQQRNLDPGEYDFMVFDASYKLSKNGNAMVELILKIWDYSGKEYTCYDWLVDMPAMEHKTRHFWESVGHPEFYEKGKCFESDFLEKQGVVKTKLQKSEDGERMNIKVVDYMPSKGKKKELPVDKLVDDNIPF